MGLRIKPGHSLSRLDNGAVWIGPPMYGLATELFDESGSGVLLVHLQATGRNTLA